MISVILGKRYERLLFFTAPISLATILVCLVATASTKQFERVQARCYETAVQAIDKNSKQLSTAWKQKKEKWEKSPSEYRLLLSRTWIYGSDIGECYRLVAAELDSGLEDKPPNEVLKTLRTKSESLRETPLSAYGISFPKEAVLDIYVTKISINFLALSRILQIVLLPALLLWLGSLYGTRYREAFMVGRAVNLSEVFPHIINQYPAFDIPTVKKRDPLAPYLKPIARFWYACTRLVLLIIFIGPPVSFYLYSLFLSGSEDFNFAYLAAGVVVTLFTFTNFLAEFLPAHYYKIFPDPRAELQF